MKCSVVEKSVTSVGNYGNHLSNYMVTGYYVSNVTCTNPRFCTKLSIIFDLVVHIRAV